MGDEYRGSSPSWFRTVRASRDTKEKVKSLASAIQDGRKPDEERQDPKEPDDARPSAALVVARR